MIVATWVLSMFLEMITIIIKINSFGLLAYSGPVHSVTHRMVTTLDYPYTADLRCLDAARTSTRFFP